MKPTAERLELATYPMQTVVPPRFSDVDMFRHLNNVAIGQFYEEVRFALIGRMRERLAKGEAGRAMVVNVDIAYLREGRYPDLVTVATGIASRGRRSFVLGHALFQGGVCFSASDTTVAYVGAGGPAPLPPEFDPIFDELKLPSFVDTR